MPIITSNSSPTANHNSVPIDLAIAVSLNISGRCFLYCHSVAIKYIDIKIKTISTNTLTPSLPSILSHSYYPQSNNQSFLVGDYLMLPAEYLDQVGLFPRDV